jgi:hypothetical protein
MPAPAAVASISKKLQSVEREVPDPLGKRQTLDSVTYPGKFVNIALQDDYNTAVLQLASDLRSQLVLRVTNVSPVYATQSMRNLSIHIS